MHVFEFADRPNYDDRLVVIAPVRLAVYNNEFSNGLG